MDIFFFSPEKKMSAIQVPEWTGRACIFIRKLIVCCWYEYLRQNQIPLFPEVYSRWKKGMDVWCRFALTLQYILNDLNE